MNKIDSTAVPPLSGTDRSDKASWRIAAILIVVALLAAFLIRATGYPRFTRHDARVGAYVLDAVQNGNWIIQKDSTGEIASKPPLLTWCAAAVTLAVGGASHFALHVPAAISLCATALVLLAAGRKWLGWRVGFFAAFAYVVSPAGYSQLATARYDGVLALLVILAALAAFRAWIRGSGWTWFWLAAAVGTLAKGPLAVILGAAGLLAVLWERRSGSPLPLRGNHFAGLLVFLGITGGWFALAYGQLGQPLIDKMIGRELVGHAVGQADGFSPLEAFLPPLDFLVTFAPWSLLSLVAFWRVWKRPDADATLRRFERFLASAFIAGLILFCCAGHHRGRLIVPLIPFAALLAGRELADLTLPWSRRRIFQSATALIGIYLVGVFINAHFLLAQSQAVQESLAARQAARLIAERLGADAPVTYVDSPFAVQFFLGHVRPTVSIERAAELLRGEDAAWVAVCDFAKLEAALGPNEGLVREVLRWPETGEPWIRVVGNHPWPSIHEPVVMLLGPLRIESQDLELARPRMPYRGEVELSFRGNAAQGSLKVENQGDTEQVLKVRVFDEASPKTAAELECRLAPGATWELPRIRSSRDLMTQAK